MVLCFVPAIVCHEVMHGYAAYKLGDPTAKSQGRLSLNPVKHIDPFGTVVLPLILVFMGMPPFGYAKPVPYNPRYFKNARTGDVIVGLAGPFANLVLALIGAAVTWILWTFFPLALFSFDQVIFVFLFQFAYINLVLMFFNLLPIPPLDGSSVLALFIPEKHLPKYYQVQRYALPILLVIVFVLPYIFSVSPISIYFGATADNLVSLLFFFLG